MAVRTRLPPEQRRARLLDLGASLFATAPYEDVHIERVAEMAGVSRGLLYHYFPTKRAFFAALVERASDRMMRALTPASDLPPLEQLDRGIEAYLDNCRANIYGSQAMHRGAASGDPDVLAIIERNTRAHQARILAILEPDRPPHPLLAIAVRSWLIFLRTAAQEWLLQPDVPRDDVRRVCASALLGAVGGLPTEAFPDRVAELLGPREINERRAGAVRPRGTPPS